MIKQLTIRNFKSIKELTLPCKKLNVFIGEPNSGKSNIIEALALQSQNAVSGILNKDIFRYKNVSDLFFDFKINNSIQVITDERTTELSYPMRSNNMLENAFHYSLDNLNLNTLQVIGHDGRVSSTVNSGKTNVHFYEFKRLPSFTIGYMPHLNVPFGDNLPSLLLSNTDLKSWVSEFFRSKELRLTIRPTENDIAISKFVDDEIYSYPYFSISETLQRVVFYSVAIKSNNESVILFDEPESNTFPFYTKFLAERISLDETNQFFITSHNPYLLMSLIEKTKFENLNVCLVKMEDYKTTLSVLNEKQVSKVLDFNSDIFFNFDKLFD